MPRAPAYSRPQPSQRTPNDMSLCLRADAELGEEPQQRGVGALVVDDEAGVERDLAPVGGAHRDRVGMAAEALVALVERHVVACERGCGRP